MDEMEQWKFQQMVDNVDFLLQKIESLQDQIYKLEDAVETLGTKVSELETHKKLPYGAGLL